MVLWLPNLGLDSDFSTLSVGFLFIYNYQSPLVYFYLAKGLPKSCSAVEDHVWFASRVVSRASKRDFASHLI